MRCGLCAIKSPKEKGKGKGKPQHEIGGYDVPKRFHKRYGRICPDCMPTIAKVFNNLPTSLKWLHSNEITLMEIIEEELKPVVWKDLKRLCEAHEHEGNCRNILTYIEERKTNGKRIKTERLCTRARTAGNFRYEKRRPGSFEGKRVAGCPS